MGLCDSLNLEGGSQDSDIRGVRDGGTMPLLSSACKSCSPPKGPTAQGHCYPFGMGTSLK